MRTNDLVIAVVIVFVFALIAVPYQLVSSYWADSPLAWIAYAILGLAVAVYIAYAFLRARRHLMTDAEKGAPEVES